MKKFILVSLFGILLLGTAVNAKGISTHVLDLAKGVGGQNIPVTLEKKNPDGAWAKIGSAKTDDNGRVKQFDSVTDAEVGTYRLSFDMTTYSSKPFFPEITVSFQIDDPSKDYHVPVVVSPFGYSTYRGN